MGAFIEYISITILLGILGFFAGGFLYHAWVKLRIAMLSHQLGDWKFPWEKDK